ncbi:hypothetical protein [Helicobacter sp. 23-1045]
MCESCSFDLLCESRNDGGVSFLDCFGESMIRLAMMPQGEIYRHCEAREFL